MFAGIDLGQWPDFFLVLAAVLGVLSAVASVTTQFAKLALFALALAVASASFGLALA